MRKKSIPRQKNQAKSTPKDKTLPQATDEISVDVNFPIVGIGASAGGLAAFEAFFSGMPAHNDPGMAFVLVQHMDPDHKSILTDLIRRHTRMQVFEVMDGITVRPNCAYIIPPGRDMAFLNGTLQLMEPSAPRGHRLPIDFFFRSLAQDQQERAIGVVLSGTGSDGTMGIRAIKGAGGMVMVQTPDSTEYDGMPRSAIATGLVDYELPPPEMPTQIIAYVAHAFCKPPLPGTVMAPKTESALKKIFILLRAQTSHDFSQYKPSTINRRIISWNRGAVRMYGWSEAEALLMNVRDRIPEKLQEDALAEIHQLNQTEILEPYRTQRIAKDGTVVDVWMTSLALLDEAGHMYAFATTERVIKK